MIKVCGGQRRERVLARFDSDELHERTTRLPTESIAKRYDPVKLLIR